MDTYLSWNCCYYGQMGNFYDCDMKYLPQVDDITIKEPGVCSSKTLSKMCYSNINAILEEKVNDEFIYDILALQEVSVSGQCKNAQFIEYNNARPNKLASKLFPEYHLISTLNKCEGMVTLLRKTKYNIIKKLCYSSKKIRAIQMIQTTRLYDNSELLIINVHNGHGNTREHINDIFNEMIEELVFLDVPEIVILGDFNWKTGYYTGSIIELIVKVRNKSIIVPIECSNQHKTTSHDPKWDNEYQPDSYSDFILGNCDGIKMLYPQHPASDHYPLIGHRPDNEVSKSITPYEYFANDTQSLFCRND